MRLRFVDESESMTLKLKGGLVCRVSPDLTSDFSQSLRQWINDQIQYNCSTYERPDYCRKPQQNV